MQLRPTNMPSNRLFVNYQNGSCVRQFIGKNKIREIPKTVAAYLNLNDPDKYTGHCFSRSSATALSASGANLTMVQQLGSWRSASVAQSYIENSESNKISIYEKIALTDKSADSSNNKSITEQCVPSKVITNKNDVVIATSASSLKRSGYPIMQDCVSVDSVPVVNNERNTKKKGYH